MDENTKAHEGARVIAGRNGGRLTPFTPETSRLAAAKREEKRIQLYMQGAGLAVQDAALVKKYGEDAHIVERARTMQEIATTQDAGKAAVLAAAHLDKAQGLVLDKGQQAWEGSDADPVRELGRLALEYIIRRAEGGG